MKYIAAVLLLVAAISAQNVPITIDPNSIRCLDGTKPPCTLMSDGHGNLVPIPKDAITAPSTNKGRHLDITAIARDANGSVVSIVMSDKEGHFVALGSGFLISKDGWIITNYHVIKRGTSAVIKIADGPLFPVDGVLAADKDRDVAIIKAHGNDFRPLTLGNSDLLQKGEEVVAIGSPLGLESTVSNGLFSGIRTFDKEGRFLQITAPISHGSSGGPLFNRAGEVVGITTLMFTDGQNLNFAIPINDVKPILPSVMSNTRTFPNEAEDEKNKPSPEIKAEADPAKVQSAFVWGECGPAIFSTAIDPLTGNKSRKLSYQGVEVGERVEIVGSDYNCSFWACKEGGGVIALLKVTFTLVNNTKLPLQVQEYSSTLPFLTAKQAKEYFKCGSKHCGVAEVNRDIAATPAGEVTQFELYLSNTNCGNESIDNGPLHTVCSGPFRVQVKLRGKNFVFVEPAG